MQESERTQGQIIPGIVGIQAGRLQVVTSASIDTIRGLIAGMVPTGPARPSVPHHSDDIRNYVNANPQAFFLPTVALGVLARPRFYSASKTTGSVGWLVIPRGTPFHIIDGHHRLLALTGAKVGKSGRKPITPPGLADESLSLLVVFENSAEELDQHFADSAQALPVPKGQTILLDARDPINRITRHVADGSDFLRGRLEGSATRLPPLSQFLFTAAAFRGLVIAYLEYNGWDARSPLPPTLELDTISNLVAAIDVLSSEMTPWNEIATAPMHRVGAARMAQLRASYLNMHAVGLVLVGRALGRFTMETPAGTAAAASRIAQVDWRRDAEQWRGIRGASEGAMTRAKADIAEAWDRLHEILRR